MNLFNVLVNIELQKLAAEDKERWKVDDSGGKSPAEGYGPIGKFGPRADSKSPHPPKKEMEPGRYRSEGTMRDNGRGFGRRHVNGNTYMPYYRGESHLDPQGRERMIGELSFIKEE